MLLPHDKPMSNSSAVNGFQPFVADAETSEYSLPNVVLSITKVFLNLYLGNWR